MDHGTPGPCPWGRWKKDFKVEKMNHAEWAWISCSAAAQTKSRKELSSLTNLSARTIQKYSKLWRDGRRVKCKSGGQFNVDEQSGKELITLCHEGVLTDKALDSEDLKKAMSEKLTASFHRRNQPHTGAVSRFTYNATIDRLGLTSKVGQDKTDARRDAQRDPLGVVSTYTLFQYIHCTVPSMHLVVNYDATTFTLGGFSSKKRVLISVKNETYDGTISAQPKASNDSAMSMKYYAIISVAGKVAPLVFLFANPDMHEDALDRFEVEGLSIEDASETKGFVVFTKTRAGNQAFYEWFIVFILVPFLSRQRTTYARDYIGSSFVLCDGEDEQILQYANVHLISLFETQKVEVGKSHPSTTQTTQACDAGKLFSGSKKILAAEQYKLEKNPGLKAVLADGPFLHGEGFKPYWTSRRRSQGVDLCMHGRGAIAKMFTRHNIMSSWNQIGFTDSNEKIDQIQIFKNSGYKLTLSDMCGLAEDVVKASSDLDSNGCHTDEELINNFRWLREHKIQSQFLDRSQPRDQLTICRQRCTLLLHKKVTPALVERRKGLLSNRKITKRKKGASDNYQVKKQKVEQNKLNGKAPGGARRGNRAPKKHNQDGQYGNDDFVRDFDEE